MNHTPIYTALQQYAQNNILRLHMPGHIGRAITAQELQGIAPIDVTEVPGLDDLHLPQEIIAESRRLLADAFGAAESYFLVNGATSGIQALFLALTSPGEKVLLPRNAHRSFFGGLALSGAWPVYIPVQTMPEPGIALAVTVEDVKSLLQQCDKAVFLVSPSYYGAACDLSAIADVVHEQDRLLLVDEAHGAHFSFSSLLPPSAIESGADAAVNGLHKTWPVLNQGACLHLAPSLKGHQGIKNAVSMLTTTSPSYPLLASIELAREMMEGQGEALLGQALGYGAEFKQKMQGLPAFKYYNEEIQKMPGVKGMDGLKVVIGVENTGLTGYEVAAILRQQHHIQVEMAETGCILAMFSLFHQREDWDYFYHALQQIATTIKATPARLKRIELPPYPNVVLSPRQAFNTPVQRLPRQECRGKLAGEMVAAYPPGVPCLLPGELITETVLDYLDYLQKSASRVQGPQDSSLQYLNVLDI
jgi:arginine decarboxylase